MASRLVVREAYPWPSHCAWINTTAKGARGRRLAEFVVHRAFQDIGLLEDPIGSNRGFQVEEYLRRAKVPEKVITAGKGYWCAAALGCWFIDAGARVPSNFASCDAWLPFIDSQTPSIGSAVLFGKQGDAVHIELVARVSPMVFTIGGNTSINGQSRNGIGVFMREMTRQDVLGYVSPTANG